MNVPSGLTTALPCDAFAIRDHTLPPSGDGVSLPVSVPTTGVSSAVVNASLTATGSQVDALNQRLSKSSQAIDLVGRSADRVFNGSAPKAITNTTAKLQAINGVKAEQAFDLIGNSAAKNTALAGRSVDVMTGKLNAVSKTRVNLSAYRSSLRSQLDQAGGIARAGGTAIGNALGSGLNSAVRGWSGSIARTSADLVSNAILAARKAADAHSPSRKMIQLGSDMAEGLAVGIKKDSKKSLEAAQASVKNALAAARSQMQSISSTTTDAFRSDIFSDTGIWGTTGGPIATLKQDIRNAKAFNQTLHTLAGEGLKGGAFAAVATSGNLQAAQALAANKRDAREFQSLFVERQRVTRNVGRFAGQEVEGKKVDDMVRLLEDIRQEIKHLPKNTGEETGKALNKPAGDASRKVARR